jgi:probable FeS assembly SUF system protein SufT
MRESEPVALTRDLDVVEIPAGTKATLPAGAHVLVTQTLGGNYTVMTVDGYLFRVDGKDADALGHEVRAADPRLAQPVEDGPVDEELVWDQLRTVYDPEIPVNIVDLGLVYKCDIVKLDTGGNRVDIAMTMTAPGCGMGEYLKADVEEKLGQVPGVKQVDVEIVWEPVWDRDRMSEAAKLQLGMM